MKRTICVLALTLVAAHGAVAQYVSDFTDSSNTSLSDQAGDEFGSTWNWSDNRSDMEFLPSSGGSLSASLGGWTGALGNGNASGNESANISDSFNGSTYSLTAGTSAYLNSSATDFSGADSVASNTAQFISNLTVLCLQNCFANIDMAGSSNFTGQPWYTQTGFEVVDQVDDAVVFGSRDQSANQAVALIAGHTYNFTVWQVQEYFFQLNSSSSPQVFTGSGTQTMSGDISFAPTPSPEPFTFCMTGAGLALAIKRSRRKQARP